MTRRFLSYEAPADERALSALPVDSPVAVYYRQSTAIQVGNISTGMQQIDLVDDMKRRGWREDDIIPINADAGISGTLRIDERVGMSQLFALITSGTLGAVATQDEDRLFRDVTMIQVDIFIDACLRNRVQVITPSIVYVFHHPTMGQFYVKQFRFKCEMAAEYLNFLKSRLGGARNWLLRHGMYAGGRIPLGYMVIARVGDEKTPRRYLVWPEIAALVLRVFEVYVECGGHSSTAARRLVSLGVRFPDFSITPPPDGYAYSYQGGSESGFLSAQGIREMVSNPAYLGHWMYKGAVLIWNNHEPLMDERLFFQAFNYVSPYTLDGSENPNYRPAGRKFAAIERRPGVEYPLLKGLLRIWFEGKWRKAGIEWSGRRKQYDYVYYLWRGRDVGVTRQALAIDEAVQYNALECLRRTFSPSALEQGAQQRAEHEQTAVRSYEETLRSLGRQQAEIVEVMPHYRDPRAIRTLEDRFTQIADEIDRVQVLLQAARATALGAAALYPEREKLVTAMENWHLLSWDGKRGVIEQLVRQVELSEIQGSRVMLTIRWFDQEVTTCPVWMGRGATRWTFQEQIQIASLVQAGASKEAILAAMPERSWETLRKFIQRYLPDAPTPRSENPPANWISRWENSGSRTPTEKTNRNWTKHSGLYVRWRPFRFATA